MGRMTTCRTFLSTANHKAIGCPPETARSRANEILGPLMNLRRPMSSRILPIICPTTRTISITRVTLAFLSRFPLTHSLTLTPAHTNLLGWDPKLGAVAISVMKEKDNHFHSSYWFLLRSQNVLIRLLIIIVIRILMNAVLTSFKGTEVGWIPEAKTTTSRIARFPTPHQLELALKKTLKPHLKKAELHPVKVWRSLAIHMYPIFFNNKIILLGCRGAECLG